jgi:hypothetical protein
MTFIVSLHGNDSVQLLSGIGIIELPVFILLLGFMQETSGNAPVTGGDRGSIVPADYDKTFVVIPDTSYTVNSVGAALHAADFAK